MRYTQQQKCGVTKKFKQNFVYTLGFFPKISNTSVFYPLDSLISCQILEKSELFFKKDWQLPY